jgi:SAM-dependent methyltransferase
VERTRILSVGCGIGVDVDLLTDAGFDVVGIDNGNRTRDWPKRRHTDRLYLANGKALPFESGTFDLVYCGCVFPHIGVEGDSNHVRPDYLCERLQLAREMTRVLKPGGSIMVSSPNRMFPLDLFHGRSHSQPFPRLNLPTNPFLLSASDYRRMFGQLGCDEFELLPVTGYWGFLRKGQTWKGRVIIWPVRMVFDLVSTETLKVLRGSVVNPWLVMMMAMPRHR